MIRNTLAFRRIATKIARRAVSRPSPLSVNATSCTRSISNTTSHPAFCLTVSSITSRWSLIAAFLCAPAFYAGSSAFFSPAANADASTEELPEADSIELVNWSGTHAVSTDRYYTPESLDELKALVRDCHERSLPLRPVGSALSPNGLGLNQGGMVNMALMDKVLWIDKEKAQIRVQAGIRVEALVEALRPHGLSLANYASIVEQQIGGFSQIGAHGTGAQFPSVDEQVIAIKLITPAAGEVDLAASTDENDDMLFRLARTSLGLFGIVAELTLQCVPAHRLREVTRVFSRADVAKNHSKWIREHRHLRYMWIPYTDSVVVVTCDLFEGTDEEAINSSANSSKADPAEAARHLLLTHPDNTVSESTALGLSFTELRTELLRLGSLDPMWVAKVNKAEESFWRQSEGVRIDWSDRILQFDCGGEQWVSEVCFPVPESNTCDVEYVESVLDIIENEAIPAPAPIEQRWSAPSTSPMSAASGKLPSNVAPMYSWVGIIMYLPEGEGAKRQRDDIKNSFWRYKGACERLWGPIGAVEHWAKIEMPQTMKEKVALQLRTANKYPLDVFNAVRSLFDPKGILSNELMSTILDGGSVVRGDLMQDIE